MDTSTDSLQEYKFILFVSGMSVKSIKAIENINKIRDKYLKGKSELNIIDVNEHPELAVKYQIIGLPTLIKEDATATKMILGDLSDTDKVLKTLNLL